jgi:hypothetical protein
MTIYTGFLALSQNPKSLHLPVPGACSVSVRLGQFLVRGNADTAVAWFVGSVQADVYRPNTFPRAFMSMKRVGCVVSVKGFWFQGKMILVVEQRNRRRRMGMTTMIISSFNVAG